MDLSKIRLIVTDMDGTLLNPQEKPSAVFFEQFKKLQARKDDYVTRMSWALNSPCSALYVNDEVDQVRETFFSDASQMHKKR